MVGFGCTIDIILCIPAGPVSSLSGMDNVLLRPSLLL